MLTQLSSNGGSGMMLWWWKAREWHEGKGCHVQETPGRVNGSKRDAQNQRAQQERRPLYVLLTLRHSCRHGGERHGCWVEGRTMRDENKLTCSAANAAPACLPSCLPTKIVSHWIGEIFMRCAAAAKSARARSSASTCAAAAVKQQSAQTARRRRHSFHDNVRMRRAVEK